MMGSAHERMQKHPHNAGRFTSRSRRSTPHSTAPGARFTGFSTPLQDEQGDVMQGLTLEHPPEMAAASQGQETGTTAEHALVSLDQIRNKLLVMIWEVGGAMAAIRTSSMAEDRRSREGKNRKRKRKFAKRAQEDSRPNYDSDLVERQLSTAFSGYVHAVERFGSYLHEKWSERAGKNPWQTETLEKLLRNFKKVPERAHAAFKREFSSAKHLIWEHHVSISMFSSLGDPSVFGGSSFEQFRTMKYAEIFPHSLVEELGGLCRNERTGRLEGDTDFWAKFEELAKHVWSLHKLVSGSSNSPRPVILLRVPSGTAFQATHHSWVMHPDPDPRHTRIVDVMLTAGLCVGDRPIVKSRVLCSGPG